MIFILKKLGFNLKPHQTIEELYSLLKLISESYLTTGEGNHQPQRKDILGSRVYSQPKKKKKILTLVTVSSAWGAQNIEDPM